MTPEQQEKGENLWRSAQNILQSSRELETLFETAKEVLSENPPMMEGQKLVVDWDDGPEESEGGNDWITMTWSDHANVYLPKARHQKKPRMVASLSLHLILVDNGNESAAPRWKWRGQPSLIIGWHRAEETTASLWDDESYWWNSCFDPNDQDCVSSIVPAGEHTWSWYEDGEISRSFGLFAVPLFALKDENDLLTHVVDPLKKLFEGRTEAEAFPANSPAFRTGIAG